MSINVSTPFTIHQYNPEEHMTSSVRIPVSVHGYWGDILSITISRCGVSGQPGAYVWEPEVNYSGGGLDRQETAEGYLDAKVNFASALVAAIQYAKALAVQYEALEADYQAYIDIQRAAWEKHRAL